MAYYIALKASGRSAQVFHKSTGVQNMGRRNFLKKAGSGMAAISLTPGPGRETVSNPSVFVISARGTKSTSPHPTS